MNFTEMRNKLIENFNDITKDVTHVVAVANSSRLSIMRLLSKIIKLQQFGTLKQMTVHINPY